MRLRYEVRALEPGRRFSISGTMGPVRGTADYMIEPAESGSRVILRIKAPATGALTPLRPLLRGFLERDAALILPRLKRVLEAEGGPQPA